MNKPLPPTRSCFHASEFLAAGSFVVVLAGAGIVSFHILLRWILEWGDPLSPIDSTPVRIAAIAVFSAESLLAIWARFIEPRLLGATRIEIESGKVEAKTRVVFISDMHVSRFWHMRGSMTDLVAEQKPDLIILGGDYINTTVEAAEKGLREAVSALKDIAPTWGVQGNADLVRPGVAEIVRDSGVSLLTNEHADVLRGISIWGFEFLDHDAVESSAGNIDKSRFNICLTHEPSLMFDAAEAGFDLFVAGHTHGGQIRVPWYGALITLAEKGKKVEMGRYDMGNMTGYVVRGVGVEGGMSARVRLLCRPEFLVVDIVPVRQSNGS